ncbi:hypothetical protein [Cryobacterium sp. PH29-G1]|uniref:hypothetical protein n=1 Tax=Cryobacterium sp. PH29-G1 TaxID=3046211 RepID=UPI0024B9F50B|nr:hypothetical protein [Cryobacterium sp. PH29-G1]MDJ0348049.1 hypothetical protein [Cryobacterium sp. PH29-G1]
MSSTNDDHLDAAGAARLLEAGAAARARADSAVDYRTLARMQFGIAGSMFIYLSAFLLLVGNQQQSAAPTGSTSGFSYSVVLLIPFLVLSQLVMGASARSRVLRTHRRLLVITLVALVPFGVVGVLNLLGVSYPWGINLLVAAAPATPLIWQGGMLARRAGPTPPRAPRTPLNRPARIMTGCLGLYFGLTGMLAAFSWFALAGLGLMLALVALLTLASSRWGLPSLGSDWRSPEWNGFAASFILLVTLAVVLARTDWNTPLAGVVGGVLVAAPLVVAAIRGARS